MGALNRSGAVFLASILVLVIASFGIMQVGTVNAAETLIVEIDIKPSKDPNKIGCKLTDGTINVAMFGSSNFVVRNIDVSTLKLQGKSVTEIHGKIHQKNLNGDSNLDAIVHLNKVDVCNAFNGLPEGQFVSVTLTGLVTNGQQFEGTDTVKIDFPTEAIEEPTPSPPVQDPGSQPNTVESEIHRLVNEERAKAGKQPLQWNERLAELARQHSADMRDNNYFSHGNFAERIRTVCGGAAGENIFYSFGKDSSQIAEAAVTAWMNSSGHKANILSSFYHSEGVGIAISESKVYVTQDFCS
ncbi:MAG TPA: CAP domain-containing protein [Nitrososphaerales archaeon]|nr:CAP domain-containing protein [Nitrososphaerales archaeon]